METQLHEIHKQVNWLKKVFASSKYLLTYLILAILGRGTLAQEYSPNHGNCFFADNYYCLPNMLHSLKSFPWTWAAFCLPTKQQNRTEDCNQLWEYVWHYLLWLLHWDKKAMITESHTKTDIFFIKPLEWSRGWSKGENYWNSFFQDGASPTQGATSTNWNLDNFCVPFVSNAPCSVFS